MDPKPDMHVQDEFVVLFTTTTHADLKMQEKLNITSVSWDCSWNMNTTLIHGEIQLDFLYDDDEGGAQFTQTHNS